MNFASLTFVNFFLIVMALLVVIRHDTGRKLILLSASYYFYAYWDVRFTTLIIISTVVDFFVGRALARTTHQPRRKQLLFISIAVNLGLLGFFKYFNFFVDSANVILSGWGWNIANLDIILPVGISFYTFQTMSYTIDIYRGTLKPTKSFLNFATFVAFFPQLVAGPIVRASEFLPQLERGVILNFDNVAQGFQIFIRGLFLKLVLADNLSIMVDQIYAAPHLFSSLTVWVATFAYSIQILSDFAGYSDMAIGLGRMMGFTLPQNFDLPYTALSITAFWRRWHMSLSSWLRDYLYIPLGGNRKGITRTYINLMLTMLLGGLWHGASWNFVIWGGLHGVYLVIERYFGWGRYTNNPHVWRSPLTWLRATAVFLLTTITWVFFRSPSFTSTLILFNKLFFIDSTGIQWFQRIALIAVPAMLISSFLARRFKLSYPILTLRESYAPALITLQLLAIFFLAPTDASPFIYFQF